MNPESPTPSPASSPTSNPALRRALWGSLLVVLLAVAVGAVLQRSGRSEPPPVLGHAPDFALTNRDGRTIRNADLAGRPWIANFVFTRCAMSCPVLTARMSRLNRDLPDDLDIHLVSFSVDPEHDTPAVLARYAESYSAPDRWLFLTGGRDEMLRLIVDGFKLALDPSPPPGMASEKEPILHSTRFMLVDGQGDIRGYYDGMSEEAMEGLERDLRALTP